jgi:hypothetical protein
MRLADVSECLSTYFENISISSPFCDNGAPAKRGVAVFQRYGHRYFLDEISISAGSGRFFFVRRKRRHSCRSLPAKPASTA